MLAKNGTLNNKYMRKRIIFILFIVASCTGLYVYNRGRADADVVKNPNVLGVEARDIPSLETLVVQVDESSGNRRVLHCGVAGCDVKNPPKSVDSQALSDGQSWYRYTEHGVGAASKIVLERVDGSGDTHTITEESQLVRPRGIFMSTDGTKIAYFLDNTHDNSGLTELWVYDDSTESTRIVAENLHKADIASRIRWNASSRVVWFVTEKNTKELVLVPLSGTTALPTLIHIALKESSDIIDHGVMDANDDGTLIASVKDTFPGFSQIVVTKKGSISAKKTVKGSVVFIRWMQNGALLYAVQNSDNLTFWMADTVKEWPIARMKALFQSAHSTGSADLAAFIANPREGESHLYVLQIGTGLVKDQMVIPNMPGATSYLVQANESQVAIKSAVSGSTSHFPDAVITAFISSHITSIVDIPKADASRIMFTDSPNTVFVDYSIEHADTKRILVTIQDVTYPTWKVLGTYAVANGEWKRVGESHGSDPRAVAIYDWEDELSQWILKQKFSS